MQKNPDKKDSLIRKSKNYCLAITSEEFIRAKYSGNDNTESFMQNLMK